VTNLIVAQLVNLTILWNPTVHYRVRKSATLNPNFTLLYYFFKIHFKICFHLCLLLPTSLLPSHIPTNRFGTALLRRVLDARSGRLIFIDFYILN
jgi:hypothetical protein